MPRTCGPTRPIRSSCSAQEDNALVGGLALANIRRGVAQAGSLGYWVGAPYVRRGYMTAAVRALIPVAFDVLRLHRLEAACIPTNLASVRLLEKTGFRREGYARAYLCINGIWQDHLLYARPAKRPAGFRAGSRRLGALRALGPPRSLCYKSRPVYPALAIAGLRVGGWGRHA